MNNSESISNGLATTAASSSSELGMTISRSSYNGSGVWIIIITRATYDENRAAIIITRSKSQNNLEIVLKDLMTKSLRRDNLHIRRSATLKWKE